MDATLVEIARMNESAPQHTVIPVAALIGTFLFLVQVSRVELLVGGTILAVGVALGAVTRVVRGAAMQ